MIETHHKTALGLILCCIGLIFGGCYLALRYELGTLDEQRWQHSMDDAEAREDQADYDAALRALAWPEKWERRARASRCFLYRGTVKDGLDDDSL